MGPSLVLSGDPVAGSDMTFIAVYPQEARQKAGSEQHNNPDVAVYADTEFDTWRATKQLGWAIYAWGATSGVPADNLENYPDLLSVIAAN